jgi:hypothetical protein
MVEQLVDRRGLCVVTGGKEQACQSVVPCFTGTANQAKGSRAGLNKNLRFAFLNCAAYAASQEPIASPDLLQSCQQTARAATAPAQNRRQPPSFSMRQTPEFNPDIPVPRLPIPLAVHLTGPPKSWGFHHEPYSRSFTPMPPKRPPQR